ncbi:hypothetical protein [Shimia thalassica]|uniref:hypothetical protein n=1 Tax=Shimia thalassica TaxID=1715693 RepID=UPI0026E27809|nr:hypothetical protein [Shimia thalassica]MDO6799352.1 hypothetical protein [Shimia thalassica]
MNEKDPNLWLQVFDQRSGLLAVFGALGGMVRSATIKTSWREGVRVTFIGSATAFGVGVLSPYLVRPWVGELPAGMSGALGTLCASAFIVGLVAVTMIERFLDDKSQEGDG